jgi:hypothetical protein
MHLTRESQRRLLAGTIDEVEARAIAAHLVDDCPECEALLASQEAGPLDGLADHALTSLAPTRPEEEGNDIEYARIQRVLHTRRPARRRWAPLAAAAAAALLTAGVGVHLAVQRSGRPSWAGEKGGTAGPGPVQLRVSVVAVQAQAGGQPRIWKVAGGDELPANAALQLRMEVGAAADVALARVGTGGTVHVFWHEWVDAAGPVRIAVDGRPAAYPLAGLVGQQRFVALASPGRLAPERVAAAAGALAPPAPIGGEGPARDGLPLAGISIDVVEITVR